jgi:hypothetical protein
MREIVAMNALGSYRGTERAPGEDVKTDGPFQVLYGDDLEADAPLQGFTDGKVLVGGAAETATAIPTEDIHSALPIVRTG